MADEGHTVCLRPSVCHTERVRPIMSRIRRELVFEIAAPDRFLKAREIKAASRAIMTYTACAVTQRISSLDHLWSEPNISIKYMDDIDGNVRIS